MEVWAWGGDTIIEEIEKRGFDEKNSGRRPGIDPASGVREKMETSKANLRLLDFQDLKEVHEKRIPHSISMPLDELEKRIRELDKDKEMAVHCLSGLHSYKACLKLKHADFDKIKNVDEGLLGWIYDTEAGEKKE